ncbi:MAG: hypothetical protein J6V91_00615, partial [Kiritimatiellae bacterium]|nr:hypothetical protein [Kiritimatiellia bacterium]
FFGFFYFFGKWLRKTLLFGENRLEREELFSFSSWRTAGLRCNEAEARGGDEKLKGCDFDGEVLG